MPDCSQYATISLQQFIKITNHLTAADGSWHYPLPLNSNPLLHHPPNFLPLWPLPVFPSFLLCTNQQTLDFYRCFNIISCSPCGHIFSIRDRCSSLVPPKTRTQVTGQALLILSSLPPSPVPGKGESRCRIQINYSTFRCTIHGATFSTVSATLCLGGVGERWLRGSDEQGSPVKPTADEANHVSRKLLSIIWSTVEGYQGQAAAAAASMQWASKNGDRESPDIDTN